MEVRFEKVEKWYGDFCAVQSLDLTIASGALHFLLGPSGCGKTTTLRMLAGLEKPSSGRIFIGDQDYTHSSAQERGIGMVFQNYALWPHMNVRKNIEYGLKLKKLPKDQIQEQVEKVLSITQLSRFAQRLPGQLSGGQQQRVALARALAIEPRVLLLDEPLSNLDAKLRLEMRENICRIHDETKITTVYVTHDQKEALSMGTCVSVMYSGQLLQSAPPRELYRAPRSTFVANFIGEANIFPATIRSVEGATAQVDSPLGSLQGTLLAPELKPHSKVHIALRPEAFQLPVRQGASAYETNQISAALQAKTYLGEAEQFLFNGPDNTSFKTMAMHCPNQDWQQGDQLDLTIAARDVYILPEAADLGQGT